MDLLHPAQNTGFVPAPAIPGNIAATRMISGRPTRNTLPGSGSDAEDAVEATVVWRGFAEETGRGSYRNRRHCGLCRQRSGVHEGRRHMRQRGHIHRLDAAVLARRSFAAVSRRIATAVRGAESEVLRAGDASDPEQDSRQEQRQPDICGTSQHNYPQNNKEFKSCRSY